MKVNIVTLEEQIKESLLGLLISELRLRIKTEQSVFKHFIEHTSWPSLYSSLICYSHKYIYIYIYIDTYIYICA